MNAPNTLQVTLSPYEAEIVRWAAAHDALSLTAWIKRAIRRDLGARHEEIAAQREYDDTEIGIPRDPKLARFALLVVPQMEDCESERFLNPRGTTKGCAKCRHWINATAPQLIVSTDRFSWVGSNTEGRVVMLPREGAK